MYEKIYLFILDLYFKKKKITKLEIQSDDVKFVPNKFRTELMSRNKFIKIKMDLKYP
jgi:hypothetical protein